MEKFEKLDDLKKLKNNKIVLTDEENLVINNSNIVFEGNNNILIINNDAKVTLTNTNIKFKGNNSIVYLNSSMYSYILNLNIYNNCVFYMGKNNYMNGILNVIVSEEKNVIIGNNCLFSFGVWIRTADPHLIYSTTSHKRINLAKSVFIGDHVWIGQSALLLKGTTIGSGSIVGAGGVISKKLPSNCIAGGNPVRILKSQIFWDGDSTHAYDKLKTQNSMYFDKNNYIYKKDNKSYIMTIEKELSSINDASDKAEYLKKELSKNKHDRFCIISNNLYKNNISSYNIKRKLRKSLQKLKR